ncbi:GIY-YIG nuclease family protein [Kovacikia minuta CCNUW1]|uniref:GIY-YIG nuclease family protein n=1 Tax=Kovacikia minuta TaxID=2931930 RepID=UPI001CCC22D2|nr:GIY-YIG nuclease family protein [Kovacikia minuta]UBF29435.1 GIY-YIG nuclease family protein [Kovacikia minuta CCNUW1]
MACGVYQIVNKVNGKSYVGQSRNIKKRWRQHIAGLDATEALGSGSYPLRAAFLKYGLQKFEFKIIEECAEENLLYREKYWIEQIKPQYNCNIWTPARKKTLEKTEPKFWIQYHNYNKLGYLPGEFSLDNSNARPEEIDDLLSGISTGKRAVLSSEGDTVFLIVGIGENPKQYYLMYKFIVEDIQIREDANADQGKMRYDAFGDGWLINPPQLLNSLDFDQFKKYCGNFGFGFMSISRASYLETLNSLSEQYKSQNVNFSTYIEQFYNQVSIVNPNESSALAKKGTARHLAISIYPDEALPILTGITTKLIVFEITDLLGYKGKLLIHTLDFYEEFEPSSRIWLQENCLRFLKKFGLNQEMFSVPAIQGWIEVDNIFKYDQESFARDEDAHGRGADLHTYKLECGFPESDAWCIEVSQPVFFEYPIPLPEPEDIYEKDLWFPISELEIKAFRLALNSQSSQ